MGVDGESNPETDDDKEEGDVIKPLTTISDSLRGKSATDRERGPGIHQTPEKKKHEESYRPHRFYRTKYKTFILSNAVMEVEQRYDVKAVIGHGAYGTVATAVDLSTGKPCAIKKIENIFEHRSLAKRTLRELQLLRQFRHENICSIDRIMRPRKGFNNIYFTSELMETDLASVIRSPQELTDEHCQFFIYQVLRGLKFIHSADVMHRDLKPRNLLVNSNCDLKICDFGLARLHEPENNDRCVMSNYIATRWYRAPEVILSGQKYTKAVDMWAVGCILAELVGRKPIFPGMDSFHQIQLIISVIGTPVDIKDPESKTFVDNMKPKPKVLFSKLYPNSTPACWDLLDRLFEFDPEKRITVEEALQHEYLAELHCEEDEPVCTHFKPQDFYWEYLRLTKDDLRHLMTREAIMYYPLDLYEAPKKPDTSQGFLNSIKTAKKLPPRTKRKPVITRRKSWS
eukprot:gb/GEZN01004576.1/.p1 GENE.gb/GEZN01004576.1/~~gb/GEZN01004576.1/.p1  ORF type:complete len:500 (+),score=60.29 gb/GEZN01004576.1/:134-1501(+)